MQFELAIAFIGVFGSIAVAVIALVKSISVSVIANELQLKISTEANDANSRLKAFEKAVEKMEPQIQEMNNFWTFIQLQKDTLRHSSVDEILSRTNKSGFHFVIYNYVNDLYQRIGATLPDDPQKMLHDVRRSAESGLGFLSFAYDRIDKMTEEKKAEYIRDAFENYSHLQKQIQEIKEKIREETMNIFFGLLKKNKANNGI
jgi:peptidoglycan hydrolase CwlO-like protein